MPDDKITLAPLPTAEGYKTLTGWTKVAEFDKPITELKVRRGKLTAKSGDMWHIVPSKPR